MYEGSDDDYHRAEKGALGPIENSINLPESSPRDSKRIVTMVSQLSEANEEEEPLTAEDSQARLHSLVFSHINNMDLDGLERHLDEMDEQVDLTTLCNSSGFSPLHLAAFKSLNRACDMLIKRVLRSPLDGKCWNLEATPEQIDSKRKDKLSRRLKVRNWVNL